MPVHAHEHSANMIDVDLFNHAHLRYLTMAKCHRLAYNVATRKEVKLYHYEQAKKCIENADLLKSTIKYLTGSIVEPRLVIIPKRNTYKGKTIPIERYCHS